MEELKTLIAAVAGLPTLTLWVLVGYLIYKLAVIGSIYGVIRLAIEKTHNVLVTRKAARKEDVEIYATIQGQCITQDGSHIGLLAQIERVRGKGLPIDSSYIHRQSVQWLREAIDAKEIEDAEKAASK